MLLLPPPMLITQHPWQQSCTCSRPATRHALAHPHGLPAVPDAASWGHVSAHEHQPPIAQDEGPVAEAVLSGRKRTACVSERRKPNLETWCTVDGTPQPWCKTWWNALLLDTWTALPSSQHPKLSHTAPSVPPLPHRSSWWCLHQSTYHSPRQSARRRQPTWHLASTASTQGLQGQLLGCPPTAHRASLNIEDARSHAAHRPHSAHVAVGAGDSGQGHRQGWRAEGQQPHGAGRGGLRGGRRLRGRIRGRRRVRGRRRGRHRGRRRIRGGFRGRHRGGRRIRGRRRGRHRGGRRIRGRRRGRHRGGRRVRGRRRGRHRGGRGVRDRRRCRLGPWVKGRAQAQWWARG